MNIYISDLAVCAARQLLLCSPPLPSSHCPVCRSHVEHVPVVESQLNEASANRVGRRRLRRQLMLFLSTPLQILIPSPEPT